MSFRVYIIKCLTTDKCYVSYTESTKSDYNPVSYLYSVYKKAHEKYLGLGESIDTNGMKNHKYMFVKKDLSKDEAADICKNLKEKLQDRLLNDVQDKKSYFDNELALLLP
jgi:hypothetical protein